MRGGGLSGASRASLEGASTRAAALSESCSLVRVTTEEPSRSCHGEGNVWQARSGMRLPGPSGVWGVARVHGLGRNRRDPSAWPASGKDRGYKPMVKSSGGQRESEGVVVPLIGVQHNAPGGKGPHFDHAGGEGKREGMAGSARSNHPGGLSPVVAGEYGAGRMGRPSGESATTAAPAMGCGQAV